jgi:hypothetical protein
VASNTKSRYNIQTNFLGDIVKAMAFSKIMKKEKKNKVPHSTIISVL